MTRRFKRVHLFDQLLDVRRVTVWWLWMSTSGNFAFGTRWSTATTVDFGR